MLAKEAVALTMNAPYFADASLGDDFLVLWVFDTAVLASTYSIDDDLNESMWLASAIEEDHESLTEAESNAWKEVAARDRHVMVSDAWDLTDEDTRLEFDSLWSKCAKGSYADEGSAHISTESSTGLRMTQDIPTPCRTGTHTAHLSP
ncbi:hypothetical protein BTHE68_39910 [Burkholderia sp. THE68]|uniref:hypothetical protein n=1 Tax=Burkholderia sp. THE68 TaxID=758782 RepID=UPI0013182A11|nr:hypothetical protein [Burkholderia sp. THE68]BBU30257.1 hypothetical protein BTHE68_39910 [Burkholderia sp. THE68]